MTLKRPLPPSVVLVEDLLDTPGIPSRRDLTWLCRTPAPSARRRRVPTDEAAADADEEGEAA